MIVLGFLLGMMCIGCSNQNEVESERYEMEGRLLKSVSGSHYIVANNGGAISMGNETGDEGIFDELLSGDLIRVTYDQIQESYPGGTTIYNLKLVEEGTVENLPQDEIDQLIEMGNTFDLSNVR